MFTVVISKGLGETVSTEALELVVRTNSDYIVTLTQGANYTLKPYGDDSILVYSGDSFRFTLDINALYNKSDAVVKVNGEPLNAVDGVYTIANVTENKTVTVEGLALNNYTVTFDPDGGELVSGELVQTLEHGSDATPPVLKRTGYIFAGWDGVYTEISKDITLVAIWQAIFDGTNPARLAAALETHDVVLRTPSNLGIFEQHSPFVVPEGRTLYIETTLNVQRGAEFVIEGNVVVLESGRINNQGNSAGGGKITIAEGSTLTNNGYVENVSFSNVVNNGTIINSGRFEVRANTTFTNNGIVGGSSPLTIHRDAIRNP